MLVQRTECHIIKRTSPVWSLIDDYSHRSKNLYNYANYLIRQEFIQNGKRLSYYDVWALVKHSEPYHAMGSDVGCSTLRMLDKAWKSFFQSIKDWKTNPGRYLGRPKIPRYKEKDGRYILGISNNKVRLQNGFVYFGWKVLKPLNQTFRTQIPHDAKIMLCRFVPLGTVFRMEIIYQADVPDIEREPSCIASIDLGVDNFATITNNVGLQPIVIKGGVVKAINQLYNKQRAAFMSELAIKNGKKWSKRLQVIQNKRNNRMKTWMHKYSRAVVDYCVQNAIDTLICGYNPSWKQDSPMSKEVNQKFILLPHFMFIQQLEYKCQDRGIRFIQNEESYTSGTSVLDNEQPTAENYDKSRRKHRGLFISNNGTEINADVNGSYQIMRKVFPNALVEGIAGIACYPMTMKIA